MTWQQVSKTEWRRTGMVAAYVRLCGIGQDKGYLAYANGKYLGDEETLDGAKKRAQSGKAKERGSRSMDDTSVGVVRSSVRSKAKPNRGEFNAAIKSPSTKIKILRDGNPCRPNSIRFKDFNIVRQCRTISEWQSKSGKKPLLYYYLCQGYIALL